MMDYDEMYKRLVEGEQPELKKTVESKLNDFNDLLDESKKVYEAKKKCNICGESGKNTSFTKDPEEEICDGCWSDKAVKESKSVIFNGKKGKIVDQNTDKDGDGNPMKMVQIEYEDGSKSWEVADDVRMSESVNENHNFDINDIKFLADMAREYYAKKNEKPTDEDIVWWITNEIENKEGIIITVPERDKIAHILGFDLGESKINEALPQEELRKKDIKFQNQEQQGEEIPGSDIEEPEVDETVPPEGAEEEDAGMPGDDVSAEPDMAGPSGSAGGSGTPGGDKKPKEPAVDQSKVETTPESGEKKESFARKGADEFFYLLTTYTPDGQKEDIQVINALDEPLWSAKENNVDLNDMKAVIRQGADKVEATNVERGILDKYWFEAEDEQDQEKLAQEKQMQAETEQATKETERPTAGTQQPQPAMKEAKKEYYGASGKFYGMDESKVKVYQGKDGKWFYDVPTNDGTEKQGPFDTKEEAIEDKKTFLQENKKEENMNESIKVGSQVIYKGTGAKGYTGKKGIVIAIDPSNTVAAIKFEDNKVYPQAKLTNLAPVEATPVADPKVDALRQERANPKPMDQKGEDEVFNLQKQYAMTPKTRESKEKTNEDITPDAKVETPETVDANQKITGDKEEGNTPSAVSILGKIDTDGCKEVKAENEEGAGKVTTEVAVVAAEIPAEVPEPEKTPEENLEKLEGKDAEETEDKKEDEVIGEGKVPADPAHITDPEKTVQELKETAEDAEINRFFNVFQGRVVENKTSQNDFNSLLTETK